MSVTNNDSIRYVGAKKQDIKLNNSLKYEFN